MNTSGRAVLFAGATVVIALLGMFALGVSLLNGVAIAAALGVVLVLAASLTLLPALLSFARTPDRRVRAGRPPERPRERWPGLLARWVRRSSGAPPSPRSPRPRSCSRSPLPVLGLRLGASDAGNDPAGQTTRKAYDLLAQGFGKGFNGPLQIAVKLPKANAGAALARLTAALRATPDVASVAAPRLTPPATSPRSRVYPMPRLRALRPPASSRSCVAGAAAARASHRRDRLRRRCDRIRRPTSRASSPASCRCSSAS